MAHSKQAAPHHAKAAAPVAHKAKEVRRKMKAVTQELAETPKMVEAASQQWGSIYQVCAHSFLGSTVFGGQGSLWGVLSIRCPRLYTRLFVAPPSIETNCSGRCAIP